MTCDGKVMVVTLRECVAMALANGYSDLPPEIDEEDFDARRTAGGYAGVAWLAMTGDTEYRWREGVEHWDRHEREEYALLYEIEQRLADRWYA